MPPSRKARAVFPAPGHDHAACATDALREAEAICAKRAQRLTPIRRRVLEALLASHHPLGAYELIDKISGRGGPKQAPITVYRALDFCATTGSCIASRAATPSSPACTTTTAAIRSCS